MLRDRDLDPLLVQRWRLIAAARGLSQRQLVIEAVTLYLDSADVEEDWSVTVEHRPLSEGWPQG